MNTVMVGTLVAAVPVLSLFSFHRAIKPRVLSLTRFQLLCGVIFPPSLWTRYIYWVGTDVCKCAEVIAGIVSLLGAAALFAMQSGLTAAYHHGGWYAVMAVGYWCIVPVTCVWMHIQHRAASNKHQ